MLGGDTFYCYALQQSLRWYCFSTIYYCGCCAGRARLCHACLFCFVVVTETTPPTAGATAAAAEPVKPEVEVVVSRRSDDVVVVAPSVVAATSKVVNADRPTTTPPTASAAAVLSTHLLPYDRRTRPSPPPPARHGIEMPTTRPTSHTAPARPLIRHPGPDQPTASAIRSDLESLPVGFELTTACPICHTPIPFDAASSDVFARHVDECISRVTKEGPSTGSRNPPAATDRTCPVCNLSFPVVGVSQTDFERHVNDHFVDDDAAAQQFEPMLS